MGGITSKARHSKQTMPDLHGREVPLESLVMGTIDSAPPSSDTSVRRSRDSSKINIPPPSRHAGIWSPWFRLSIGDCIASRSNGPGAAGSPL